MPFIPLEVFANNPSTTVLSGGTSALGSGTQETWTVASSASFPAVEIGAQQFHVADPAQPGEMITVQNVAGTTWTVIRGAESSTPAAHAAGFTVVQEVTAGALAQMQYPPWQFPVQAYGAQGDGKIGTGGTGTSGTSTFTDTGASFVNATAPAGDVGKVIVINQGTGSATVATNPFCGTISAVNSPTSVTLSANLASNASSAPYVYGTDDASAIAAAVTAAYNWARTTGNYKAQVMFEPQLYMLGALTQTTAQSWTGNPEGPYTYNTHIPVPFTGQYQRKLIIDFIGVGDASDPDFWGAAVPSVQGSCLVSAVFPPSQPDGTFGQMSVVGTPSNDTNIGSGGFGSSSQFANVLINVDGITAVTPYNSQIYGFDFRWAAQANIPNAANTVFSAPNWGLQTVGGPWIRSTNLPSNGVAVGLAMPTADNNDNQNVGWFSAEGIAIGTSISDHFTAARVAHIYCGTGFLVTNYTGISAIHGASITYWSCEGCDTGISTAGVGGGVPYAINIGLADFEVPNSFYIKDANGNLSGTFNLYDTTTAIPGAAGMFSPNLNTVNLRLPPGPWSGAPAAPASGTASTNAQQNTSIRPATIYASAATSITATFTGPAATGMTALGQSAGANVAVPIRVPSLHWYSVTYTGTLTTKWVLE